MTMPMRPCPFCGERKELEYADFDNEREYGAVRCQNCGACGPEGYKSYAIEVWNRRALEVAKP